MTQAVFSLRDHRKYRLRIADTSTCLEFEIKRKNCRVWEVLIEGGNSPIGLFDNKRNAQRFVCDFVDWVEAGEIWGMRPMPNDPKYGKVR